MLTGNGIHPVPGTLIALRVSRLRLPFGKSCHRSAADRRTYLVAGVRYVSAISMQYYSR